MSSYDLFISYRRLDAPHVRPLPERLRGLGQLPITTINHHPTKE